MARTPSIEPPSYRLQKARGLAVVRLNGRDIYLGKYGSPESKATYQRVIGEWLANGKLVAPPPPAAVPAGSLTVNELVLAYIESARRRDDSASAAQRFSAEVTDLSDLSIMLAQFGTIC